MDASAIRMDNASPPGPTPTPGAGHATPSSVASNGTPDASVGSINGSGGSGVFNGGNGTPDSNAASAPPPDGSDPGAKASSAGAQSAPLNKTSSFRRVRSRAARACEVCHARKVRCDVVNHQPCTNCVAFGCECRVPDTKPRKGRDGFDDVREPSVPSHIQPPMPGFTPSGRSDTNVSPPQNQALVTGPLNQRSSSGSARAAVGPDLNGGSHSAMNAPSLVAMQAMSRELLSTDGELASRLRAAAAAQDEGLSDVPENVRSAQEAAEVRGASTHEAHAKDAVFMGSASHISLFMRDPHEDQEISHIYTPWMGMGARLTDPEREDITLLKMKGAFLLPPKNICDDLVAAYFDKIHPMVPVVNKTLFLRQYNDMRNSPPLLLQQAIFCVASNVCSNPAILDKNGRSRSTAIMFYKRAKALFDSEYEEDRMVALTAATILSLSLDAPDKTNNNNFFWTRMAITLAQSMGLHRWSPKNRMPEIEKRMWKRVWWSLFLRDRSNATGYGRPMCINLEDTDVPMIEPSDFDESEPGQGLAIPVNNDHVTIFIHMIKLHEIMGLVLRQQYSVGAERLRLQNQLPDVSQCDMALATWVNNLPVNIRYSIRDVSRHDYFKALMYLEYYTVLCLAHRPQVVHFNQNQGNSYPSWGIAFQAAHMIVKILQNLRRHDEVTKLPAFMVYSCFSALIMLVYQTESPHENVVKTAKAALHSLMIDIKLLAKVYEAAGQMVLYAPFLSDKQVKDRALRMPKRPRREYESGGSVHGYWPEKRPHPAGSNASGSTSRTQSRPPSRPPSRGPRSRRGSDSGVGPGWQQQQPQPAGPNRPQALTPLSAAPPQAGQPAVGADPVAQLSQMGQIGGSGDGQYGGADPAYGGLSPELYMVTQSPSQQQVNDFEPQQLFPQAAEAENNGESLAEFFEPLFAGTAEIREAFAFEETSSNGNSSGDEMGAPDTLNMGEWYDYLMAGLKTSE